MHGSFNVADVHNTLIAKGPSFRSGLSVPHPTGNVDVAPTVAHLLGQSMPQADGRVLNEALTTPASRSPITVTASVVKPSAPATRLTFELPTDPTGATKDALLTQGTYSIKLSVKDLTQDGKTFRYFDSALPIRK
jgi:hypothetical protein